MKATKVDKDLCIGCGLCCGICDEVFRMNEQGKAEAYQPANAENQGAVQEAIARVLCLQSPGKINSNASICFFD